MLGCPGCARKFAGLNQLRKHLHGCPQGQQAPTYAEIMGVPVQEEDATQVALKRALSGPAGSLGFTCCYCGRDFGSASLRIHQNSCCKEWERHDSELPKCLRHGHPPKPPELDASNKEAHNHMAAQLYSEHTMLVCPGCARRFGGLEQLRRHLRGCHDGQQAPTHTEIMGDPAQGALKKALTGPVGSSGFTCCYCGRAFGSESLHIHQRECVKVWVQSNMDLPKCLRHQGPPKPPELVVSNQEEHNRAAQSLYHECAMLKCPGCAREFGGLDQLRKHLHGCVEGQQSQTFAEIMADPTQASMNRCLNLPPGSLSFTCCYCGREFGSTSLRIHQLTCIKEWEQRNIALPNRLRRARLPDAPELDTSNKEEHNQRAMQIFQENTMLKCPGCAHNFVDLDQLKKHLHGCSQGRATPLCVELMLDPAQAAVRKSLAGRRESLGFTCCFCGLEFGSQSLRVHQKKCREKWLREDAVLPRVLRRGSLPEPPELDILNKQEHNTKARELYVTRSMVQCSGCDRRFAAIQQLKKHMAGCLASLSSSRRDGGNGSGVLESPVKTDGCSLGFTCCFCGQDYGSRSLGIHQRLCRERWARENDELPKELQKRELPTMPPLDMSQKDEHNRQALAFYRDCVMLPCPLCDRRFGSYEGLQQHLVSCSSAARHARLQRQCRPSGGQAAPTPSSAASRLLSSPDPVTTDEHELVTSRRRVSSPDPGTSRGGTLGEQLRVISRRLSFAERSHRNWPNASSPRPARAVSPVLTSARQLRLATR